MGCPCADCARKRDIETPITEQEYAADRFKRRELARAREERADGRRWTVWQKRGGVWTSRRVGSAGGE